MERSQIDALADMDSRAEDAWRRLCEDKKTKQFSVKRQADIADEMVAAAEKAIVVAHEWFETTKKMAVIAHLAVAQREACMAPTAVRDVVVDIL